MDYGLQEPRHDVFYIGMGEWRLSIMMDDSQEAKPAEASLMGLRPNRGSEAVARQAKHGLVALGRLFWVQGRFRAH
jgi:hypothetical protein